MDFNDLQNGFYNAFVAALGLNGQPVQLIQPSPPLEVATGKGSAAAADRLVWQYFNLIPVDSLTGQYVASGGSQFFSNYSGLLSELMGSAPAMPTGYTADIRKEFVAFLKKQKPRPLPSQYGQLFRNWAMLDYPDLANTVSSWYSQVALDPVTAAQNAILLYTDESPDFSLGYADLVAELNDAPSRTFDASTQTMNSDVSSTWSSGGDSGFLGLWGSSDSSSTVDQSFAQSSVEVSGSVGHVTTFTAAPGAWYDSHVMALSWSQATGGSPWTAQGGDWQRYFDPSKGELARFATSLIVASNLNLTITSDIQLSSDDATKIQQGSSAGMWPFYSSGGSSGSSAEIKKADQTGLEYVITSAKDIPIVLGALVLPVSEYTGHAAAAAQAMARAMAAMDA